ncbi:T9SS type B sorting domain-containing protein [Flavobacterium laiguense]|uniref:Uncharacterized protein n=1 Tax=Flavobacterium laiguense TaxID=2169409 RepID=A0A2U1K248_9FLAO|nr:T9SS type B sorting domain-containing protein [Flavobacterium laiguense]PWA11586.1 hypothetical protein DB891_01910 [Flavobacterium laiguense]
MKKCTSKFIIAIVVLLLFHLGSYAQNLKPFTPRFDQDLNGSMLLIGNNILSKDNNDYNITTGSSAYNSNIDMVYVDIDGDPSTFSSSSATLTIPNPSCAKVRYAGLYWSALLQSGTRTEINKVKLKVGAGSYTNIVGEVIKDVGSTELAGGAGNRPYACYADITSIVNSSGSAVYTVADVLSSTGRNGGTGLSAGWSIVVVYEDPTLSAKSITTFDGFSGISASGTGNLNVNVVGFRTIPNGPVRAEYAFSALEGDRPINGDFLMINGTKVVTVSRPLSGGADNFFNSTVTNDLGVINTRVPKSTNSLGFDAGILKVPNPATVAFPGGSIIKNKDESAIITFGTSQDTYFIYFNAFAVEIIEPNIVITKVVQDALGNDMSNANVTLGQNLFYEIEYQNKGNDDAVGFTIKDILPLNTIFNPIDLDLTNSGGATYTYDAATRTIIFTIPDSAVQENDPKFKIRFKVQVVLTCNELSNACSNIIRNQAFGNYKGRYSGNTINQDPSIPSASPCLFAIPSPTNFLVGLDGCVYTRNEILCGATTTLNAASGYSTYSWSKNADGSNPFAFTQSITVNAVGTYYVRDTAIAPCLSITEIINVSLFGGTVTNPVLSFADQIVTCPNDGKKLPLIFLCGGNATKLITSGISDGSTIVWEILNENASCPAATSTTVCANESNSCTWTQVGTGQDYLVNAAGQYRMVLNYPGGCFNRFYFNVYQNLLNPTATAIDKVCTTAGQITVGGVPPGYEYSLDGVTYQDSNVFVINIGEIYTAFVRQKGVTTNPCVFTVPNIFVRERDFTVDTFITQPLCNGGLGSVKLAANDVLPQYFYKISQGGSTVNSVGPIIASDYTFGNLLAGTYQAEVSTSDGCISNFDVIIPNTPLLQATAAITIPLTCNNGEVTVSPTGGTPPYFYFVNSTTIFQGDPKIVITAPGGVYNIDVVDANNCPTTTSITVAQTPAPTFDVTPTNVLCAGTNTGTITFGSIVTNGNTLRYAIDVIPGTPAIPGTPDTAEIPATPPTGTFVSSPVFAGLAPGTYAVAVEYTIAGQVCYSNLQTVIINPVSPIVGSASLTQPYTCGQNGEITATASGGVGLLTYSIDGVTFQASQVFGGLTNGTYSITIKDANGCAFLTNSVTIDPLTPPTDLGFVASALSCSTVPPNVSSVTVTPTGGFGALAYTILPALPAGVTVAGNVFSGLAAGTYTFQVTDAKNCSFQKDFTIVPLPTLTVIGQLVSNVKCFNTATGAIRFTVSNFGAAAGFTYTINGIAQGAGPASGIIDLVNQPAGTYTVVVTDVTTTCTATISVTVANAPAALTTSLAVSPIKCLGVNGSVTIIALGGWGGYSYTLTPPAPGVPVTQASNTFANLSDIGNYTVVTTDANGCPITDTFTLTNPVLPTASIDPLSDLCFDGVNAAILVVTTGNGNPTPATAVFDYSINGGATYQASNTFSGLAPNAVAPGYTVTVRDGYGCTATASQTIQPQLTVGTVLSKDLDCNVPPDAAITGTISGGTAPYAVSVITATGTGTLTQPVGLGTTFTYVTTTPADYQFQVTDATGLVFQHCTALSTVTTINPIIAPTFSFTQTPETCNTSSDGTIVVTPTAGVAPFKYIIDGGLPQVSNVFTNLQARVASYQVQVVDDKGCLSVAKPVTITEPDLLTISSVVSPFTCTANVVNATVVTITGGGGITPYTFSSDGVNFLPSNTLPVPDTKYAFSVIDNGAIQNITYFVKDSNGCLINKVVTINPFPKITTAPVSITTPIDCKNTGTVTISPVGGSGNYTYQLLPSLVTQVSNVFSVTVPGTYSFQVNDVTTGCTFTTAPFTVAPFNTIDVVATATAPATCFGDTNGSIAINVTGYLGAYSYKVLGSTPLISGTGDSSALNPQPILGLTGGSYTVEVTETASPFCIKTSNVVVVDSPSLPVSVTTKTINDNCNANAGQITAIAQGGTGPYTYQILLSTDPAPTAVSPGWVALNTLNAESGNYIAYAKDSRGCIRQIAVLLGLDPTPVIAAVVSNQCTAIEGGFAIDVTLPTAGIAPYSYSVDGGAYQIQTAPFTINNLASGAHTVQVKDFNGCGNTVNLTIYPVLKTNAVLTKDITCSLTPTKEGLITVTTNGGNGLYTYKVKIGIGAFGVASPPFAGPTFTYAPTSLLSETYTFEITDANGCIVETNVITTTPALPPTATINAVNPTCNGSTDGSIKLEGSGGEAPYTYSISGVGGLGVANVFGGLTSTPGIYNFIIRDNKGCDATGTVTFIDPVAIVATTSQVNVVCSNTASGNTLGSITPLITAGGVGPFVYKLYNNIFALVNSSGSIGANTYTFPSLNFGDYYYTIVDANGCELRSPKISILAPIFTTIPTVAIGLTCADGATVVVTAEGVSPFTYSIVGNPNSTDGVGFPINPVGPTLSTTNTFVKVPLGTNYIFKVTDANGCEFSQYVPIPNPYGIAVTATGTNITCNGAITGSVAYTVRGYSLAATSLNYSVVNTITNVSVFSGSVAVDIAGADVSYTLGSLPPGSYSIYITEVAGSECTAQAPFDIIQPTPLTAIISNEVNANCFTGAQLTIAASGGTGPYQYAFVADGAPRAAAYGGNSFTTLNPPTLNWDIWVKDFNGCEFKIDKTIILDPIPIITTAVVDNCVPEGTFTINVTQTTAGVAPYTMSVNGSAFQSVSGLSYTISNLNSGTYTIIVKDANGCESLPVVQTIAAPVSVSTVLTKDVDCSLAPASPDATITITIKDGYPDYSYRVSINGFPFAGAYTPVGFGFTTFTYTIAPVLSTTTYQFEITDANNCTTLSGITTINPIILPTATTNITNVSCNGSANGSVTIVASLGVGPYTYSFNGSLFTSITTYTNLAGSIAGIAYPFIVRDSKGCLYNGSATITEPAPIAGTAVTTVLYTCLSKATIEAQAVAGGTAPYEYSIDGVTFQALPTFAGLVNGTYSITIKDANDCTFVTPPVIIAPLTPPTDLGFVPTAITCPTNKSDVALTATGGFGALEYQITAPVASATPYQGANVFNNLAPGTYTFQVKDAKDCTYQEDFTIVPLPTLTVVGQLVANVQCFGTATGSVQYTVAGFGGAGYTYTINGVPQGAGPTAPAVITIPTLLANTYTIVITDVTTNCTVSTSVIVTEPATSVGITSAVATNVNCNKFDSQITVIGTNGTPNYTYTAVIAGTGPPALGTYGPSNVFNVNTVGGTVLGWDVYVKDNNGCVVSAPTLVTVILDPPPSVAVTAAASNQCNTTGALYTFTATGASGIPPYEYSIGNGYQTIPTFTVALPTVPTSYTVTIRDANGCTATSPTPATVYPPLGLSASFTTPPICINADGTITAVGTGGTGAYTYTLLPVTAGVTEVGGVFSNVPPGNYTITVADSSVPTACTKTVPVTIAIPIAPVFVLVDIAVNNVSCNGANDAIITVNLNPLTNIDPLYTYTLTPTAPAGPPTGPQSSSLFSNLPPGTYDVTVTSGRGCPTKVTGVVVAEPTVLAISSVTATPFACALDNSKSASTVTIIALAGSGTAPYLFSIDGINYTSTNTFSVIDNGTNYTLNVNVKDANGCMANGSVVITTLIPLTAVVNQNASITCTNPEDITITANGGSGTYSYQLLPIGIPNPNVIQDAIPNIFHISAPGDYYFQVNDVTTGCTFATAKYTVVPFNLINVTATPTASVTCFGDTNGTAVITITGYTGTYDYQVLDSSGNPYGLLVTGNTTPVPITTTGLTGDSYTVRVTETATPFCTFITNTFTIASPATALAVTAVKTADATCTNDQGTITATGIGGWGALEYELVGTVSVGYSSNSTFGNLPAGNYTVNVRDSKGCISSSTVVVLASPLPILLTASASVLSVKCNGDTDAIITATVNAPQGGQVGNYSYTLNVLSGGDSGPQTSPVFGGLGAGTYTVTVTDGWNCSGISNTIVIDEPAPVTASLVLASGPTCNIDPIVTLTTSGGTAPYTYNIDGGAIALGVLNPTTTIPIPLTSLPIVNHYYVEDANGCKSFISNDILIEPLEPLLINLDLSNAFINCKGDASGVIVAKTQGGLGNYTYTLLDGSGNPLPVAVQNSPGIFTQLFAGFYQIQVDSGIDCKITSVRFEIKEPVLALTQSNVVTNVLCNGNNDGQIVITAQGGTGIIQYAITPNLNKFVDQNTFIDLAPGNYQYIVQDQAGCFELVLFAITEPNVLTVATTPNSIVPEICFGDVNGEFKIDIAGGTQQYSTSLDNVNGVYTVWPVGQTQIHFTGLTGGSHTVYVKDANGCTQEWTVVLPPSVFLDPKATVNYACVSNIAGNTVTVTIDTSNNPVDVDYALDGIAPYQASNVFVDVAPGTHFIQARHTNGCIDVTSSFDIAKIDPLALTLSQGSGLNQIVATPTGGSGIYQFTLNGESYGTQNKFIYYRTGDYTVAVTDSYGCTATATMYFEFIDIEIPNVFTPNGSGTNDTWKPEKTDNYPDMILKIFDRYGRVIATLGQGQSWDGNYHGAALPMGDYWYVLKLRNTQDDREFVGHFTLYR